MLLWFLKKWTINLPGHFLKLIWIRIFRPWNRSGSKTTLGFQTEELNKKLVVLRYKYSGTQVAAGTSNSPFGGRNAWRQWPIWAQDPGGRVFLGQCWRTRTKEPPNQVLGLLRGCWCPGDRTHGYGHQKCIRWWCSVGYLLLLESAPRVWTREQILFPTPACTSPW